MTTAAEILTAALRLPESERLDVARQLADSVPPAGVLVEGEPGFFEELDRRIAAMESGEDPGIDGFEAILEVQRKLDGQPPP